MSNFERVLSKEEAALVAENLGFYYGSEDEFQALVGGLEQSILAKPAEQEPIAWIFEDELPSNYPYEEMFKYSKVDVVRVFPVYAPTPTPCVSPTSDKTACVSEIEESETQRHLEYIKRYQNWRRGEDKTMSEAGINPKQLGESLDWLIAFAENHIPDSSKTMHLSVSIDAKEVEAIVQAYLDNLEGWKLVPKEPSFKRNFYLDCLEIIKEVKE